MKKVLFAFSLLVILFSISQDVKAQNCKPSQEQVAVFTQPLYMGSCTVLDQGDHLNISVSILRDSVRSIIVGRNVSVRLCEQPGLKGTCETFYRSGDVRLKTSNRSADGSAISFRVTRLQNAPPSVDKERNFGVVIFDSKTGYILGGSQRGALVKDKTAATFFKKGDSYRFYGLENSKSPSMGVAKDMLFVERCSVYLAEFNGGKGSIGISSLANWNPAPRIPKLLEPKSQVYERITREFLESKGISNPVIKNKQIIRVDLEGDGVDEVILSGRHVKSEDADVGKTFKKGSYSFILVRKIIEGEVKSIPIGVEVYTADIQIEQWTPRKREVTAILDLDGDGVLEIVVHTTGYEGYGTTAYKIKDGKAKDVLNVGCGA